MKNYPLFDEPEEQDSPGAFIFLYICAVIVGIFFMLMGYLASVGQ